MVRLADEKKDKEKNRKLRLVDVIIIFIFIVLVLRLWHLQVVEGDTYAAKSTRNRIASVSITAPRGNIYDRNNVVLANNRMAFTIAVIPQELSRSEMGKEVVIARLSSIIGISEEEIQIKIDDQTNNKYSLPYQTVRILEDASIEVVTKVEEQKVNLPGVVVEQEPYRNYPEGATGGAIVGYEGLISLTELETIGADGYTGSDRIGKSGIERAFESSLKGDKGKTWLEVDSRAVPMGTIGVDDPVAGDSLVLTIDIEVQRAAEEALYEQLIKVQKAGRYKEANAGAAVAINPNTGEIIALCSYPNYDPNIFVPSVSEKDWAKLNEPISGLFNRAIAGAYPPGSIFKPITASAALEANLVTFTETFNCVSGGDRYFGKRCWIWSNGSRHASQTLFQGIANSCNIVFYELGRRLSADQMADMARRFGLSQPTGLSTMPKESPGIVPDSTQKLFTVGDRLNYAIGQQVTVTPLQMAVAYAAIATKGKIYQPFLVKEIISVGEEEVTVTEPILTRTIELSESTWDFLLRSSREVTRTGTAASAFRGFALTSAGKTGTAQDPPKDAHAWFVGWAPYENPEIVVAVLVERGGSGASTAAPIARSIMEAFFKIGAYTPVVEE